MNEMKMPGFTADASLRPAGGRFHDLSVVPDQSDAVTPQTRDEADEFMRSLLLGPGLLPPPWVSGVGGSGSVGSGGRGGGDINFEYQRCLKICSFLNSVQRLGCEEDIYGGPGSDDYSKCTLDAYLKFWDCHDTCRARYYPMDSMQP